MNAAFVYDPNLRRQANRLGKNYWYEHVREINAQLGLCAVAVPRAALGDAQALRDITVLIVGDLTSDEIGAEASGALENWVRAGGILIGFATEGLDALFGNAAPEAHAQPQDDYTVAGRFDLRADPVTEGVHSYLHPDARLVAFSDIRSVRPEASRELARLFPGAAGESDTGRAVVTGRELGRGHCFYFGFDVPKTAWVLHQGLPVDRDRDGDGWLRTCDAIVPTGGPREVACADELLFLLQNMVGRRPQPLIHQLPPTDGRVPDALFYYGGDDEGSADGVQVVASEFMKSRGLPYHINAMPVRGKFGLTVEQFRQVRANGHEVSLHFDFMTDFAQHSGFTRGDVQEQTEAFKATFGMTPVCSVNHCVRWTGWSEAPAWMAEAGILGDNSRFHSTAPPMNPVNTIGFGFGTAFPYYNYHDYRQDNARINFISEPIFAYEVGYTREAMDSEILHRMIDLAAYYHLTADLFYHPCYLATFPACRAAVDEMLRYIEERGLVIRHMGNDELALWWSARSRSRIEQVRVADGEVSCRVAVEPGDGIVVKVPLGERSLAEAWCGGQRAAFRVVREFGQNWGFVICPQGDHEVRMRLR
ncbi:MAG: hypothetical protein HY321_05830 [Armatimonadetes bacterium]|nr:hypothetical protein [Armatimonadota bacterium]